MFGMNKADCRNETKAVPKPIPSRSNAIISEQLVANGRSQDSRLTDLKGVKLVSMKLPDHDSDWLGCKVFQLNDVLISFAPQHDISGSIFYKKSIRWTIFLKQISKCTIKDAWRVKFSRASS